jgi:GNAT superfamily N-acetyltransferase
MSHQSPPGPPRLAIAADLEAVVTIIRLSFADDPVWGAAFPPEIGEVNRSAIWRLEVGSALRLGWTWLTSGGEAASVWIPPGEPEIAPDQEADYLALLVARLGPEVDRVVDLLGRFEAGHPRTEPHYYLSLLGTHPDHRGHGHGMRLLADNLALIDAQGMPAYLESTNPANNPRYQAVGFEPIGAFDGFVPGSVVTTMWRPARG